MATIRQGKKKYKIQPIEKLSPEIRDILSMPIIGQLDADDINGDSMFTQSEQKILFYAEPV